MIARQIQAQLTIVSQGLSKRSSVHPVATWLNVIVRIPCKRCKHTKSYRKTSNTKEILGLKIGPKRSQKGSL